MISPHHSKILLHVLLPVLSGTMIYALVRGIPLIDSAQEILPLFPAKYVPAWINYNLPDGLWCYAFLSAISSIWQEPNSTGSSLWLGSAIAVIFSSEVFQAYHLIHGTFDWKDLIAYVVAAAIFYLNFQCLNKSLSSTLAIWKSKKSAFYTSGRRFREIMNIPISA